MTDVKRDDPQFKRGDQLLCIEADGPRDCEPGKIYVVRRIGSEQEVNPQNPICAGLVCLEGIYGGKCIDRFKLVRPIAITPADIDAIKRMAGTDGFKTPDYKPERVLTDKQQQIGEAIDRAVQNICQGNGILGAYRMGTEG